MKGEKTQKEILKELQIIPGIGKSIAKNLFDIGIHSIEDLVGKNPEKLFALSNQEAGAMQDRCLLYTFRCAVYYAEGGRDKGKLLWWNWKDTQR